MLQMVREIARTVRTTQGLVCLTFLGLIVWSTYPDSAVAFGVVSGRQLIPGWLHTLVTYSLIPGGIGPWLLTSISIICSGLIVEKVIKPLRLGLLIVASSVIGGLAYVPLAGHGATLLGTAHVAWGFGGAALVFGGSRWRKLPWFGKLYVAWVAVSFLLWVPAVFEFSMMALAVSQLAAGMLGLGAATWWALRRPNNRLKLAARGRPEAEW